MAPVKISELSSSINVTADDVFPVVDSAVTKKASAAIVKDFVLGRSGSNNTIHISSSDALNVSAVNKINILGTTNITGSLTVTQGITGSLQGTADSASVAVTVLGTVQSASYALTASYALNGVAGTSNSISASWASSSISSSYASVANAVLGTVQSSSYALTASYAGLASNTVSASFAASSSFALSASWAPGGGGGGVTSVTAGNGLGGGTITSTGIISIDTGSIHFLDGVKKELNTEGVISSSLQINTGSFSGSFRGTLAGTGSWATTALTSSYFSGSIDFTDGLIVTGSVTASTGFSGSLTGLASNAISSSFAASSSFALSASWAPGGGGGGVTSVTAGDGLGGGTITSTGTITVDTGSIHFLDGVKKELNTEGVISSSLQINTGSFSGSLTGTLIGTSSWATTASTGSYFSGSMEFTNGLIVTGSITASTGFSGSLIGLASNATSASFAISSSFALSASWAPGGGGGGGVTSVTAGDGLGGGTITSTGTISLNTGSIHFLDGVKKELNTEGVVSSSAQINTGSFRGTLIGTSSWATTAETASYFTGFMDFAEGLIVTGSITASTGFSGSLTGLASNAISSSFANSSSFALSASWAPGGGGGGGGVTSVTAGNGLTGGTITSTGIISIDTGSIHFLDGVKKELNTEGVISSSTQINTGSFSGSLTGTLIGTSSWATNNVSSSFATTANFAITASYFTGSVSFPSGLIVTGSILATTVSASSFIGPLTGTSSFATSASFAASSSFALSASWAPGGGGGGGSVTSVTAGNGLSGGTITSTGTITVDTGSVHFLDGVKKELNTEGVISSSLQINTGSFSGSFTGIASNANLLNGLDSTVFATTGSNRFVGNQNITGSVILSSSLPVELRVIGDTEITGSLRMSGNITSSLFGTSSWATNAASASSAVTGSYFSGSIEFPDGLLVTGSITASAGRFSGPLFATSIGTSGSTNLTLQSNATTRWNISSTGHLLAEIDNTYDIGASGVNRPRDIYLTRDLLVGGRVTASNTILAENGIRVLGSRLYSEQIIRAESGINILSDSGIFWFTGSYDSFSGNTGITTHGGATFRSTGLELYAGGVITPRLVISSSNGNVGINEMLPDYRLDVNGTFGFSPGTSVTPVDNGDVVIEATNNTTLTFKLKGSDGVVRSATLTLAP